MTTIGEFTHEATTVFGLSFLAFLVAMLLTPIYTYFAYRYRFWKKPRTESTTGEALKIFTKLHAAKHRRNIPTMAGMIMVVAIAVVTLIFNFDRQQTWLPLAALIGGGIVGLLDDIINIRGNGGGIKGLRAPIKFAMITLVAAAAAWFFYYKLGYSTVYVPFVGDFHLGLLLIPLFVLVFIFGFVFSLGF